MFACDGFLSLAQQLTDCVETATTRRRNALVCSRKTPKLPRFTHTLYAANMLISLTLNVNDFNAMLTSCSQRKTPTN